MDALLPPEMAQLAERIGVRKAGLDAVTTFVLAVLAGAFIALGAIFATTVMTGAAGVLPFGVVRLLGGLVFCLGLRLGHSKPSITIDVYGHIIPSQQEKAAILMDNLMSSGSV
jgi:hypothetical protein